MPESPRDPISTVSDFLLEKVEGEPPERAARILESLAYIMPESRKGPLLKVANQFREVVADVRQLRFRFMNNLDDLNDA